MDTQGSGHVGTVIVGGGQAGLATAYFLQQRGRPAVILDAFERVGAAWRTRWDSLRLFTAARYSGLPGMRFPAPSRSFPSKDDMADYLERYAATFDLDVRTGTVVRSIGRDGDRFAIDTSEGRFTADDVVIATGPYRIPRVPPFAHRLDPAILQLHSSEYRNPSQLRDGPILVVGAGNSGADIAMEVARDHETWLSGRDTGHVPVRIEGPAGRLGFRVFRFMAHHVLTVRTPMGRHARRKLLAKGDMLVRVKPKDLVAAGVRRVGRVSGVEDGLPTLEDGTTVPVANVIWCTGFRHDYSWIELPAFDEHGEPIHDRGVITDVPGLYFVGLPFQYSASSSVLPGIGRDHEYVARHIVSRRPETATVDVVRAAA